MSITENKIRIGRFTSSEIWKLMTTGKGPKGFGEKGTTYIKEKNLEIKLGRSIKTDVHTRPIAWGNLLEAYVFDLLPFGYELRSRETVSHPTIDCWAGSCDLIVRGERIAELKCYEPKHFAEYTDALLKGDIEYLKKEHPEEYWQMVSNAIVNEVSIAEAISFMPYQSELQSIRELAENYDGHDQWKYRFISETEDCGLPYLPNDGYYQNLNQFEFEVPEEDIKALTARVLLAETLLDTSSVLLATRDESISATIIEKA